MGGDGRRTFLVVADDVDLFAALRPQLDGPMVRVTWASWGRVEELAAECRPWPWALCGVGQDPDPRAIERQLKRPVLWFWLGPTPAWLPAAARVCDRWSALAEEVESCLGRSVAGVTMAPNRGLSGPTGQLILSPVLEALVSTGSHPVFVAASARPRVKRVLQSNGLPLRLLPGGGGVRLIVDEAA